MGSERKREPCGRAWFCFSFLVSQPAFVPACVSVRTVVVMMMRMMMVVVVVRGRDRLRAVRRGGAEGRWQVEVKAKQFSTVGAEVCV